MALTFLPGVRNWNTGVSRSDTWQVYVSVKKNSRIQKYPDTCEQGQRHTRHENNGNYREKLTVWSWSLVRSSGLEFRSCLTSLLIITCWWNQRKSKKIRAWKLSLILSTFLYNCSILLKALLKTIPPLCAILIVSLMPCNWRFEKLEYVYMWSRISQQNTRFNQAGKSTSKEQHFRFVQKTWAKRKRQRKALKKQSNWTNIVGQVLFLYFVEAGWPHG